MAESSDDVVDITDDPTTPGPSSGPINTPKAQEYQATIEKIFGDFKELLKEDHKDALVVTIRALKRHMVRSWDQMVAAEVDAVIHTIHKPSCVILHQSLKEGGVTVVDPEEMPSGRHILSRLPPQKAAVKDHIITLFDSLSAAMDHLSTAFMNLSSLAKICDEETFQVILAMSTRPLCQINVLEKFLNLGAVPVPPKEGEEQLKMIRTALLP